jgi:hypothetical protein
MRALLAAGIFLGLLGRAAAAPTMFDHGRFGQIAVYRAEGEPRDVVLPAPATQKFIATVPGGEIVLLPRVGHGYSVERNWLPQYQAAYRRITAGDPSAK